MNTVSLFLCIFVTVIHFSDCYKVLVFNPAFGNSHSNFLGKISDILIDAGHDVTMLIPTYLKSKSYLVGSKKVKKIVRIGQDPRNVEASDQVEDILNKQIWKMNSGVTSFISLASIFNNGVARQCEYNFQQAHVIDFLKNENFDLGISEASFICGHAIFDHIGIKTVINADSTLVRDNIKYAIGEPVSTSYYPGVYSAIPDKMNLLERFKNLAGFGLSMWFLTSRHSVELEQIKPYYKGSQYPEDHLNRIAYSMLNSNQYLDYASPVLPKTVFVGGMQVNLKKTGRVWLNEEWEDILNERKTNVLVSFGTYAFSSDMPDEYKSAFLQVFASMPNTTFIWKYEVENSTIADHLPNVKLCTWMPQNDLLADDRLSMFVTHGGLGSTMELAYQGKPAVVIPLMSDQPRNAHMLARHGGALQFDKTKLSDPAEIKKAIETVLNDSNYAKNALKLAQILESQPNQPKDVVLKHCDFAVKFGPLETLNSSGRHLNIFQFYNIDICIVVALFVVLAVKSVLFVFNCIPSNIFQITITVKRKNQ